MLYISKLTPLSLFETLCGSEGGSVSKEGPDADYIEAPHAVMYGCRGLQKRSLDTSGAISAFFVGYVDRLQLYELG
jgi:hypothetical protein